LNKKKICLLGGTFNPIHNGHLHIAQSLIGLLGADLVLFIPSGIPPHKEASVIPKGKHRLAMVRLALEEWPRFEACDIEINRSGPSFTIDTIDRLRQEYSEAHLIFIIGMDAFVQLKTWKESERLLKSCDFALISRKGYPFSGLPKYPVFPPIEVTKLKALDSGTRGYYCLSMGQGKTLHLLSIPHREVSGTDIRRGIANGESVRNVLPHSVESYIIEKELYLGGENY